MKLEIALAYSNHLRDGTHRMDDGTDAGWIVDQEHPCVLTCLNDGIVGVPDQCAEFVLVEILPDVFHRVQLRRVRRQLQKRDVLRHDQLSMAETKCARWRGKSVPVWLIEKGCESPGELSWRVH